MKTVAVTLNELSQGYSDLLSAVRGTVKELKATKKLWKGGNHSRLIKIGLALIVFPEPTPISETVGACFVAAGAIQHGIRSQAMYVEDIHKVFHKTLKELLTVKP